MDTKERTQEQISALADGELAESQIDIALAALRAADGRNDWDVYHQIGDVLRSDDMGFALSSDFSARMAARLDAEPVMIAPAVLNSQKEQQITIRTQAGKVRMLKRLAIPGAAAAAVATMVFVTTPHLLVAKKEGTTNSVGTPIIMVADQVRSPVRASMSVPVQAKAEPLDQQESVVLRDPQIDEYLLAHQRFSPSVFSSAQYARSATFASDSGK